MEPTHFESLYPANSRESEIKQILEYIKAGSSVQITGIPGVGRSNVLELLSYNRNVRIAHVGENQKWLHFVLLNCAEIKGKPLSEAIKFIFLSVADSLRDRGLTPEHDKVHTVFKEHASFQDELVLFQGLKEAMDYLTLEKELTVVFMLDRFEEYIPFLTPEFFSRLRTLRDRAKYRFSVIFSTPRPLEELIEQSVMAEFSEFLNGNTISLAISDKPSLDFRIQYLEKTKEKKMDKKVIEEICKLTAGHGKLTRIAVEEALNNPKAIEQFNNETMSSFLLESKPIQRTLFEIWNFLTPSEQNDYASLAIPLLTDFVQHKSLLQETKKEKIIFNATTNTITKGHIVLSEALTSLEFRLLKYLIASSEKIIEREEIIEHVWGDAKSTAGVTDQALDQLIFRLRKKIEDDPNTPAHLQTIKGRGFKFTS